MRVQSNGKTRRSEAEWELVLRVHPAATNEGRRCVRRSAGESGIRALPIDTVIVAAQPEACVFVAEMRQAVRRSCR